MLKRLCFSLLLCIIILPSYSQYEGLDTNRRQAQPHQKSVKDPYSESNSIFESEKAYGVDFWVFNSNFNFLGAADVNPFIGLNFRDRLYSCVGVTGSYYNYNYGIGKTLSTYGSNVFLRLKLSSFFIHGEYRMQNSYTYTYRAIRKWYSVPILGVGYSYSGNGDLSSYVLLGIGFNPDFGYSNPNGLFIYKIGMFF